MTRSPVLADGSHFTFVQESDQFFHWDRRSLAASMIASISDAVAALGVSTQAFALSSILKTIKVRMTRPTPAPGLPRST